MKKRCWFGIGQHAKAEVVVESFVRPLGSDHVSATSAQLDGAIAYAYRKVNGDNRRCDAFPVAFHLKRRSGAHRLLERQLPHHPPEDRSIEFLEPLAVCALADRRDVA